MEHFEEIYTAEAIEKCLSDKAIVKKVILFDVTDSTNNQAKKGAGLKGISGALYVAKEQTGGRGRMGRSWSSEKNAGIYMSLMFRPDIPPSSASMLTLVAALAAKKAVDISCGCECGKIKWPNDIVVNGKKVCGILTEMSAVPEKVNYVVIGLGINVNNTHFMDDIKETASSLYLETGSFSDRSKIIADFVEYFTKYYEIFSFTYDMSGLLEEYNKALVNCGRAVRVIGGDKELCGEALGINASGALLVRQSDGICTEIMAGEVSVRGLYGYV